VAVVIPECVIGLSIAIDNAGALLSFFLPLHRSPDQRRQAIGSCDQQPDGAAAIATDPIAAAPNINLHCCHVRQDDLAETNVTCVSSPARDSAAWEVNE
jgi:hypothetical protein